MGCHRILVLSDSTLTLNLIHHNSIQCISLLVLLALSKLCCKDCGLLLFNILCERENAFVHFLAKLGSSSKGGLFIPGAYRWNVIFAICHLFGCSNSLELKFLLFPFLYQEKKYVFILLYQ